MSDLSATNCGCGCERTNNGCGSNNSCLWIILLLIFCGGGCGNALSNNGNDSCLWIILLLIFCGGCGNNNGCGLSFGDGCC